MTTEFLRQIRPAVVLLLLFTLLTGIAYPLLATGLAQDGPFALRFPRGAAPSTSTVALEPVEIARMRVLRNKRREVMARL